MANFNITTPVKGVRTNKKENEVIENIIVTDVKIPDDAPARMKVLKAEKRKWYLTVVYWPDEKEQQPFALFCTTNHQDKSVQTEQAVEILFELAKKKGILQEHIDNLKQKLDGVSNVEKLTRCISLLLRHKVQIINIVTALDRMESIRIGTFLFQIKKFLSQYIKDGMKVEGAKCSNCGSTNVVYSEGCSSCRDCGSSKCG